MKSDDYWFLLRLAGASLFLCLTISVIAYRAVLLITRPKDLTEARRLLREGLFLVPILLCLLVIVAFVLGYTLSVIFFDHVDAHYLRTWLSVKSVFAILVPDILLALAYYKKCKLL